MSATSQQIESFIEDAEAEVAGWLGTDDLTLRAVTETHTMARGKTVIEVHDGPITGAPTAITVDGTALTADELATVQWSPWVIGYPAGFAKNAEVEITFPAGWTEGDSAGESDLPSLIRRAIRKLVAAKYRNPRGLTSERIGDYSYTQQATVVSNGVALPGDIASLLKKWRKPGA